MPNIFNYRLMKTVRAFSPAHITGLFTVENNPNPLFKGSKGIGVTLSNGVYTEVKVEPSFSWKINVKSNGARIRGEVSRKVVELLRNYSSKPFHVEILHEFEVPVGSGYGASGAGALGLAIALNEVLDLGLSWREAARIAHLAEIECMTGLGTVLAEFYGGLGLRVKAGAPGIGLVEKVNSGKLWVASACWGSLPTKKIISNHEALRDIGKMGETLLNLFRSKPTAQHFLMVSRSFSDFLDLASLRMRRAMDFLASEGYPSFTMNMFGEAIFTLVKEDEIHCLSKLFYAKPFEGCRTFFSKISEDGVRVVY
jgi:pantoate kinase